jgi:hypothetical protein
MTYRLPSERVTVEVENGPPIEVERLGVWTLAWTGAYLVGQFYAATAPEAELAALRNIGAYFIVEAQPTWDIADHRGPIPVTVDGFLRLPDPMALAMVRAWLETQHEKASAVDELVPPGEAREELKRRLKASRKAA